MSQVFTKLQEIESQIDGELKQIDKKMKELKQQRLKLTGLQKALKPKTKPTHTKYVTELNIAEVAVMPIRIMPNIYFGFYNSGKRFEYKRDKEYLNALKITKPRKIKVGRVPIRTAVTTAKAQKTDMWKEAQIALNTEYNHKVKELFSSQKQCA